MKFILSLRSIVCAAMLLALVAPRTNAQNSYDFVRTVGSYGNGVGQMYYPTRIAIDSSNNIFVADTDNDRIQKFDKNGHSVLRFGTYGSGNGQLYHPYGVAVDSSGNIYVSDTGNNRIEKFDAAGNFLLQFGTAGSSNGQLNSPVGLTVDATGNIYVADASNNRIQKFSKTGVFLIKFGTAGSGNGQFNVPEDVALDAAGNIYVVEYGNYRVQKFDKNGNFLLKFGAAGTANGQLNTPYGLALNSLGNVFVVDNHNHRLSQFSPSGTAVGGTLTFIGLLSNATLQNVTFTFRPDSDSPVVTQVLPVAVDGVYTLSGLPVASGVLHIKPDKYLAANVDVPIVASNVFEVNTAFNPGDANNDNSVDIGDFGALVGVYGDSYTVGDPAASPNDVAADFDGSGAIDISDFGLLLNSFGLSGDL